MKRSTRCIAQTINLSNPRTCVRPGNARVQKLVGTDMNDPCPGSQAYWSPRPVPVRVCTRKEAQRACPPKLCACPEKSVARRSSSNLGNALWFLVKGGLVIGLVYWTNSIGLWAGSAETEDLYHRILAAIGPGLPDQPYDDDDPDVQQGSLARLRHSMIDGYNRAILKIMDLIARLPVIVSRGLRDRIFPTEEQQQEEAAAATEGAGMQN